MSNTGWVGFDLDGTLSVYEGWKGPEYIGLPVQPMIDLVKHLLSIGVTVKIFTARVCSKQPPEDKTLAEQVVKEWCKLHIGVELEVTAEKDWDMIEYYDDRAVQIEYNTGRVIS